MRGEIYDHAHFNETLRAVAVSIETPSSRFRNSLRSCGEVKRMAMVSHDMDDGEQSCAFSVGSVNCE